MFDANMGIFILFYIFKVHMQVSCVQASYPMYLYSCGECHLLYGHHYTLEGAASHITQHSQEI